MHSDHGLHEWGQQLEVGQRDDPLLALAAQLSEEAARTTVSPPVAFRRQLRRDLLNQYPAMDKPWRRPGAIISSAAALALLALVIAFSWLSFSTAGLPAASGQPEPDATLTRQAEALLPALAPAATSERLVEPVGYDLRYTPALSGTGTVAADQDQPPDSQFAIVGEDATRIEIVLRWRVPAADGDYGTFVHLVDDQGNLLAQADGSLSTPADADQIASASLELVVPESVAEYALVTGVYDAITGERLSIDLPEGPATQMSLQAPPVTDSLSVLDASPAPGTVITGTAPITFVVELDYELASRDKAILVVKLSAAVGVTGGRGVATTQVNIERGAGRLEVPVVLRPMQELNAASNLGLWVQITPGDREPPLAIEMPEAYQWRYEP